MEDSEDSESLLDFTCNLESDSDLDEELEDSVETQSHYSEVKTPSDLDWFSKILAEAQRIAVEAENEGIKEKKPTQAILEKFSTNMLDGDMISHPNMVRIPESLT